MKKEGVILLVISILLISVTLVSAESNETESETCAASISINFNQEVYYEGDFFEVTIEIFDSQGNHIPNYPFYVLDYSYSEERWEQGSSDPEYTDEQGYVEHSETLEIVETREFLYKVYTEETSSCSSVEDTAGFEIVYEGEPGTEIEQEYLPEIVSEPAPTVCAAEIDITFDKTSYVIGEQFEVEIGVFDSQGNPIPNYVFYIGVYDYDEGEWYTFEDDRTNEDGYVRHEGGIEMGGPFRFGETKFKLYTAEYSNCNSVEDVTTIEIKEGEESEPVPCGIGTCVPEEEAEEVEVIPEDEIFYKCDGCELDEKCYPMGYRKEGQYCSDNYEFVSQIDGECDNSFECKSNVCVSDECVRQGLIKKIIAWFKRLFGDEDEEPDDKICRKLLIEKNIGDNEYIESAYGPNEHTQVALYSEDGEQIDVVKCCVAIYDKEGEEDGALVCPFDNREDVENTLYWLLNKGEIILGENYKGQKVYRGGEPEPEVIIWTNNAYILASGGGPGEGQLPEDIADAYLDKYPNELEDIVG